jgi:DNA-binding HxlR family transcriptional regulator
VTYGLTERGKDLIVVLDQLDAIAHKWYAQEHREAEKPFRG